MHLNRYGRAHVEVAVCPLVRVKPSSNCFVNLKRLFVCNVEECSVARLLR